MALNKIITIEGMKYRRSYFDGNKARIEAITHKSHINILKEIFEMTITEPKANFTYIPDAENPLKIEFTNTSTDAVSYSWNFGDGSPADLTENPTHTYEEAGTYTVVLTVQDIAGVSDTETKNIVVDDTVVAPVADFTYEAVAAEPLEIEFTNTSTNAVSYRWDFGDESPIVTTTSPTHTYTEEGEYTVKLTAIDATEAEDSTSKTVTVAI